MQLPCSRCGRVLEFSGEPPTFCGYCGRPLTGPAPQDTTTATAPTDAGEGTVAYRAAAELPDGTALEVVGGYRLLRRLGAGGMGTVYEAEALANGRRVALKLLAPAIAASPEAVERFRQEGRLASALSHPRCVFVLAADEDAGQPYIVMELMPGDTLKDLVERGGPLRQDDAVARILDAIEGLQEAHRFGVVHRDVKPSNCFLGADGRVKVGDFGLSKSLGEDSHLTRTGTFLGTPLYASPEQIRRERVDAQSDIYSVAATLYYLLAGRAPFETGDATAAMARIVADPVPPLRGVRRDVSSGLERVVLRGLERNRERRWRNLDELRAALLPFAPGRLSIGGMGARFGAYLIDQVLFSVAIWILNVLLLWWSGYMLRPGDPGSALYQALYSLFGSVFWVLAYAGMETAWGCTPGKRLLGLRVCTTRGGDPPRPARALWRSLLFYTLTSLGAFAMQFALLAAGALDAARDHPERLTEIYLTAMLLFYPLEAVGILAMMITMRARNGYRGLHEFLSGTRVVLLPAPARKQTFPSCLGETLARAEGLPERVGPFVVRGALRWEAGAGVLLAEDPALGRKVFVWVRPLAGPVLSPVRRDLGRPTRLRWLAGGGEAGVQWDAFFAPPGCALPAVTARVGRLPWPVARPLLEQVADELAAACADGTLPQSLGAEQVWVHPDGRTQLLDMPLTVPEHGAAEEKPSPARALLREVAVLALEGAPRPAGAGGPPVRAPVPGHMVSLLNRLLGGEGRDEEVRRFQEGLAATVQQPVEVTRARRAGHLLLAMGCLSVGLFCCMLPSTAWPGMAVAIADVTNAWQQQEALADLEAGAAGACLLGALDRNPFVRLNAVRQLNEDVALRDRLLRALERTRRERQAHQELLGWTTRWYAGLMEGQFEKQRLQMRGAARRRFPGQILDFRAAALAAADRTPQARELGEAFNVAAAIPLIFWPVVWTLWAALWRGGLGFRMLGIALVRSDGRRASRLRCAYRALLVWVPLAALLGTSATLEVWHWSVWTPQEPLANAWAVWVSSVLSWSAAALLLVYGLLALWSPARSLHDRLAGTCLVPR